MARYLKVRLTAARAGVTMALLALIGGLAEQRGSDRSLTVTPAASLGPLVRSDSAGSPKALLKLDTALATLEHKLAKNYFTADKTAKTFLKIKTADSQFLKIDDAGAQFLTTGAAATQYLKASATAADSSELGGGSAASYSRGVAGAASVSTSFPPGDANREPLLTTPDGKLSIVAGYGEPPGTAVTAFVTITNGTGADLSGVKEIIGTVSPEVFTAAAPTQLNTILNGSGVSMIHVQLLPVAGLFGSAKPEAVTLVISATMTPDHTHVEFVAQLLAGAVG
jgi:hypothetical protein